MNEALNWIPHNRAIILDNIACAYCNVPLAKETSSREHVIGRRFVPKGKLDGNWNLILNACKTCNNIKANLENDISAITIQPDAFGRYAHSDVSAIDIAQHKSKKVISYKTKKTVGDSNEHFSLEAKFSESAKFTLNFSSPPQIDLRRVYELARLQLIGFFYWITYNKEERIGRYWLGEFWPVLEANRPDWGNNVHVSFMNTVKDWEPRILGFTAKEFFKIVIKKHPEANCWSWALEWNLSKRIVGFFGDIETIRTTVSKFSALNICIVPDQNLRYREEIPLNEEDDKLFI